MKYIKARLDTNIDSLTIVLFAICCMSVLCGFLLVPPNWAGKLGVLDWVQVIIMLAGGGVAWTASRDHALPQAWRVFWRWSIWCWMIIIARTFNWGRMFFAESTPRLGFRIVCVIIVGAAVVHFLASGAFRQAWIMLAKIRMPFWIIVMGIAMFLASESVEHNRLDIVIPGRLAEVLEETFEVPVFLALVFMTVRLVGEVKRYAGQRNPPGESVRA